MPIKVYDDINLIRESYDKLTKNCSYSLFNQSITYLELIQNCIPESHLRFVCYHNGDELISALPFFEKDGSMGKVVNSLPFYGSHGSVITTGRKSINIIDKTLAYFLRYCRDNSVLSTTLIENPIDPNTSVYDNLCSDYNDKRIGQITFFDKDIEFDSKSVHEYLFSIYHQKTRNVIRKAKKYNFIVDHGVNNEIIDSLYELHSSNIIALNGKVKPRHFFTHIFSSLEYDKDYRIYYAKDEGKYISFILIFYYKNTVEYFTPAVNSEYRSTQILSLLIYNSMLESIQEKHSQIWNWGGTWINQEGVYRFKSRFGATDHMYRYHIWVDDIQYMQNEENLSQLVNEYEYFYIKPY